MSGYFIEQQTGGQSHTHIVRLLIDELTTTNNTPTLLMSYPVPPSTFASITAAEFRARFSDNTKASLFVVTAAFIRAGNTPVRSLFTPIKDGGTDINGTKPDVNITANAATQSIDVMVTGMTGKSVVWSGRLEVTYNN